MEWAISPPMWLSSDTLELKEYLTRYPDYDYMRGLVYQHAEQWPGKKFVVME
jgi:hypothetical protein